jgi:hypothetical protein
MAKVIVSILLEGSDKLRDYEIPSHLTSEELVEKLVEEFKDQLDLKGGDFSFQIIVANLERALDARETLEEAGVWDGSLLILHPYRIVRDSKVGAGESRESPVVGWKALDTLYKKEKEKESRFKSTSKFAWKKLD